MLFATKVQQLSLFSGEAAKNHRGVPPAIQNALASGAALAISISGGKDSDAMLRHLAALHRAHQWTGELFAITADLGRIEWPGTLEHIQSVCRQMNIKLVVVRRQKGSMIDRWDERRQVLVEQQVAIAPGRTQQQKESATLEGEAIAPPEEAAIAPEEVSTAKEAIAPQKEGDKPFWSSSAARYCTKELKTAEVDRYLRRFKSVVCAVGIRAEESSSRAKKPHCQVRNDIATASLKASRGLNAEQHEEWADAAIARWIESRCKGRLALTWNAVFDWPLEQVWAALGTSSDELKHRRTLYRSGELTAALSGWPAHWAYVSGNSRLSCSMCVLASGADIQNGARHNLSTWLELALMEMQSGWSFQQGKWLSALDINPTERLQAAKELFAVLVELELVKRWGALFAIALLGEVPMFVQVFWQDDTQTHLASAIRQ